MEKKETKGALEKKIKNAIVFVPKDKDTKSIFFGDKGVRLTFTTDTAIVATSFHRHVFDYVTNGGVSRPYIYIRRFVEIALENDCSVTDEHGNKSYSYAKLMSVLKEKEDKTEYQIAWYCDIWFMNIFAPLYEIDETECGSFLVYERYIHNIARSAFLLAEHKEDVTHKQMFDGIIKNEKEFIDELPNSVILKAKSDEDRLADELQAAIENGNEEMLEKTMEK